MCESHNTQRFINSKGKEITINGYLLMLNKIINDIEILD